MPSVPPTPGTDTLPGLTLYPGDATQSAPAVRPSGTLTAEGAWAFVGGTVYADRLAGRI